METAKLPAQGADPSALADLAMVVQEMAAQSALLVVAIRLNDGHRARARAMALQEMAARSVRLVRLALAQAAESALVADSDPARVRAATAGQ
jgi:hypothetical protein